MEATFEFLNGIRVWHRVCNNGDEAWITADEDAVCLKLVFENADDERILEEYDVLGRATYHKNLDTGRWTKWGYEETEWGLAYSWETSEGRMGEVIPQEPICIVWEQMETIGRDVEFQNNPINDGYVSEE